MSARDELAAAVVGQGALPVPAGDVLPLSAERLAEIAGRAAHLYEYGSPDADEWNALAGVDVPALVAEVRRLLAERHDRNEWVDDAAEALRENQSRFETLRALCDAAEHVGIVSGGWFTVDAVRRAAAGVSLPKPNGITPQVAPVQVLQEVAGPSAEWFAETVSPKPVEGEHYAAVHHDYAKGRDFPETGGQR